MDIVLHNTRKGLAATELLSSNLDHGHQQYVSLIQYSRNNLQIYLQYFEAVVQRIRDARLESQSG